MITWLKCNKLIKWTDNSIIVNEFVPVDVILLPKFLPVVVEELVGAITEGDTVYPECMVWQPALLRADQPPTLASVTRHPVNTHIGQVLNIGAGQHGLGLVVVSRHQPIGTLV